jgi:predicted O-linked N-acetylglucosamine transferase (SPINDLY family)
MPDVTDRIRWLRPLPREKFLLLMAAADVALDPLTYGGGNTSYEALAMGTPVVTLPGALLRNRITRALYEKASYLEPVASSETEYVEKAVMLGTDPDYRAHVGQCIDEACGALFEDESELRDLEAFLVEAAAAPAAPPATGSA